MAHPYPNLLSYSISYSEVKRVQERRKDDAFQAMEVTRYAALVERLEQQLKV
jgi:hypothetical protein